MTRNSVNSNIFMLTCKNCKHKRITNKSRFVGLILTPLLFKTATVQLIYFYINISVGNMVIMNEMWTSDFKATLQVLWQMDKQDYNVRLEKNTAFRFYINFEIFLE